MLCSFNSSSGPLIDSSKFKYNGKLVNFPKPDRSEMFDQTDLSAFTPTVVDFFLRRFSCEGECVVFARCGSGNGAFAAAFFGVDSISLDTSKEKVSILFC